MNTNIVCKVVNLFSKYSVWVSNW